MLAYAFLLFGGTVASVVGFATLGVREFNRDAKDSRQRAQRMSLLLAQRRGEFVSFFLNGGKTISGRVAFVDEDALIVHVDVRRLKRDTRGNLKEAEEPPQANNLSAVDLNQVDYVEHVTEEHADADMEEFDTSNDYGGDE